MRAVILLVFAVAGCADETDPRWQLRHDRIIAIRTSPAAIPPGATAAIDGLVTSTAGGAVVAEPDSVVVASASCGLGAVVWRDPAGRWQVTAPAALDDARAALGLAGTAPVPIELAATFAVGDRRLTGSKTLLLDTTTRDNPIVGPVTINGAPIDDAPVLPASGDSALAIEAAPAVEVRWLTSAGSLNSDDDQHATVLSFAADEATSGELVVVVRDAQYGVAWQRWPISAAGPVARVVEHAGWRW